MMNCISIVVAVFLLVAKIQGLPADLDERRIWPISRDDDSTPTEKNSTDNSDRIHFYLYPHANSSEPVEIDMNDLKTLVRSTFDSNNPTTFSIHGWKDRYSGLVSLGIRDALFKKDQNRKLNFISVDWRVYSHFENYTISQQLCSAAGKVVAKFIDWMHDNAGMPFDSLTLYGTSMGSHVAGFAGKNVQRGKVHTIIALDPALPEFQYNKPEARLADTDAEYVESIQTNGGYWGFYQPIGQTSFYPNGGKYQPGCTSDLESMCSHNRAVFYIVEALSSPEENEFHAIRCDQFEHVEERKCDQYESIIRLGDPRNAQKPRGIYYLETNSKSPFAKGNYYLAQKQEIKTSILS